MNEKDHAAFEQFFALQPGIPTPKQIWQAALEYARGSGRDWQLGIYEHRCPQVTGHRGPSFVCQQAGLGVNQNSYCKNCTCPAALAGPSTAAVMQHEDDQAADRFNFAMKQKLAQARAKGRSGWQAMSSKELSAMLHEHVAKGDPRDVANFCMFLWHLKERIAANPAAVQQLIHALEVCNQAINETTSEMTVGERFTNAGQYLLDALPVVQATLKTAKENLNE